MACDWTFAELRDAVAANDREVLDSCSALAEDIAHRVLGSYEAAQELAQEAMIRAIENAPRMDPGRLVRPWLIVVTRNLAFDVLQRPPISLAGTPMAPFEDMVVDYEDLRVALDKTRLELNPMTCEIGYRRIALGETAPEIARAMGLPPNATKRVIPMAVLKFLTVLARHLRGLTNGREERHG